MASPLRTRGRRRLEGISLRAFDPNGASQDGEASSQTLPVSAAFVFIGAEPGCA